MSIRTVIKAVYVRNDKIYSFNTRPEPVALKKGWCLEYPLNQWVTPSIPHSLIFAIDPARLFRYKGFGFRFAIGQAEVVPLHIQYVTINEEHFRLFWSLRHQQKSLRKNADFPLYLEFPGTLFCSRLMLTHLFPRHYEEEGDDTMHRDYPELFADPARSPAVS